MAYTGTAKLSVPNGPYDGAFHVYTLKADLVAAGWTITRSGDGLSAYSSSGDIITSSGTGANGMDNSSAWFVAQEPPGGLAPFAGVRQIMFRRGVDGATGGYQWQVVYSYADGFTSGGSATQPPTFPTDHTFWVGAGTAASPTYAQLFQYSASATSRMSTVIGDVDENFSFHMFNEDGNILQSKFGFDGLDSGSFDVADVDPFVAFNGIATTYNLGSLNAANAGQTWYLKGLGGEDWVPVGIQSSQFVPNGMPLQPHNSKYGLWPCIYVRQAAVAVPRGKKGNSHLLRWMGTNRPNFDTLTHTVANDRIVIGDVALPWLQVVY